MPRTKDNLKREVASLLSKMTVREKASLLYGRRFWYVTGKETGEALPEIMVTDGPSGLRKQCGKADMIGLNESVPSIAYPTGSALASSWDPALLFSVGQALAEDCIKEEVSVLLGPAVNHKRDPLCGRNFEYYSEDPLLSADLGTAMVQGIQSKGWGRASSTLPAIRRKTPASSRTASSTSAPCAKFIFASSKPSSAAHSRGWS